MGQRDLDILNNPVNDIIGKVVYFFDNNLEIDKGNCIDISKRGTKTVLHIYCNTWVAAIDSKNCMLTKEGVLAILKKKNIIDLTISQISEVTGWFSHEPPYENARLKYYIPRTQDGTIIIEDPKIETIEGSCPGCSIKGKEHFDYGEYDWSRGQIYQNITCKECGLEYKEWYAIQFIGQQFGETEVTPSFKFPNPYNSGTCSSCVAKKTRKFVSSKRGQKAMKAALDDADELIKKLHELQEINEANLNKPLM